MLTAADVLDLLPSLVERRGAGVRPAVVHLLRKKRPSGVVEEIADLAAEDGGQVWQALEEQPPPSVFQLDELVTAQP